MQVSKGHAPGEVFFRNGEKLYGLDCIIAKIFVKVLFNFFDFMGGFVGEGFREIFMHEFSAIAYDAIAHEEKEIRKQIENGEW